MTFAIAPAYNLCKLKQNYHSTPMACDDESSPGYDIFVMKTSILFYPGVGAISDKAFVAMFMPIPDNIGIRHKGGRLQKPSTKTADGSIVHDPRHL